MALHVTTPAQTFTFHFFLSLPPFFHIFFSTSFLLFFMYHKVFSKKRHVIFVQFYKYLKFQKRQKKIFKKF